jgi:hypothetical protein
VAFDKIKITGKGKMTKNKVKVYVYKTKANGKKGNGNRTKANDKNRYEDAYYRTNDETYNVGDIDHSGKTTVKNVSMNKATAKAKANSTGKNTNKT